jgi:hypothetical protein
LFTGGQSSGNDLQFELDNIQIGGTVVPSPLRSRVDCSAFRLLVSAERLIRSVRFRKA